MKLSSQVLVALVLLLILSSLPSPASPLRRANAWHPGAVVCSSAGNATSDGVIAQGEYGDNYFDPATELLVYFGCDNSTERLLNVGIVSPWAGWVGLLVQASDVWDGRVNEVRVSVDPSSGALQTMDAYGNVTAGTTAPDASLGGMADVRSATMGTLGAARAYEFVVPLNSSDRYDSQLRSSGPFNFALEYNAFEPDLQSQATGISNLHPLMTGAPAPRAAWTSLEFTAGLSPVSAGTLDFLVTLRDEGGFPIPFVEVEVFVRTAFGMYDAGPTATNEQGVGEVTYAPRDSGTYVLGAAYTGGDGLLASVAWRTVTVGSAYGGGGVGLGLFDGGSLELRPVEAIGVGVVLGVWAAYAYAFFVTWISMRRTPAVPRNPNVHSFNWRTGK